MLCQQNSGRRRAHAATRSLEQRQSGFPFKWRDVLAYRRRCVSQPVSRDGDRPGVHDLAEYAKPSHVEHV